MPSPPVTAVELLRRPESYSHRPHEVRHLETHISHVFLTDDHAWKLKKPVRYDFLDFSTPELRRAACEEEVRLNRRLAADVYLGVVPVVADARGRLSLDGDGEPVDWVVQMRRLPTGRTLDRLASAGPLSEADVDRVFQMLFAFYLRTPPLGVDADEYLHRCEQHVRANRAELLSADHRLPAARVRRVHAAQLAVLLLEPELLRDRVAGGRIIEGHGDLRPEHICLDDPPVVFDCIEFSRELRTIDVADELCFLAMECDAIGAGWIGRRVLDAYRKAGHDDPPPRLLDFYKSYRACVRSKVAALRARQLEGDRRQQALGEARRYLELADGYAERIGRPLLIIIRGLMGTGKSTLAALLAHALGLPLLQTDRIRRERLGPSSGASGYGGGHYQPSARGRVYEEVFRRGEAWLAERVPVVMDGTFLTTELRERAASLARRYDAALLLVRCDCPSQTARDRIAQRLAGEKSLSEARPDLYDEQRRDEQSDPPGVESITVDTTLPRQRQIAQVLERIARLGA